MDLGVVYLELLLFSTLLVYKGALLSYRSQSIEQRGFTDQNSNLAIGDGFPGGFLVTPVYSTTGGSVSFWESGRPV